MRKEKHNICENLRSGNLPLDNNYRLLYNQSMKGGKTNMEIATTILQQLGGNRFIMMTGAKNFGIMSKERGIAFTIPRHNGIRGVRVYLNSLDTYDMHFLNNKFEVSKEVNGVYNDQLQEVFTRETGLYTHL